MALSMDEQRMLAEIERRLAAEDPGLATRLTSFRRPQAAAGLRTTQGKIIGSICTIVLLAIIGVTIYAMSAVRAHAQKTPATTQSTSRTSQSASSQSAGARAQAASAQQPGPTVTHIIGIDNVPSHNG
jgi:hypothetical protein